MNWLLGLTLFLAAGCATQPNSSHQSTTATAALPPAREISKSKKFKPGKLVIIQGPTSGSESLINVMSPRLKNYSYEITEPSGSVPVVEKYETVNPGVTFYKLDKIHVRNLKPGITYTLKVMDEFRGSKTVVDERTFQSLDLSGNKVRFATLSCMADDWRFQEVIDPMWARLKTENPQLIILNGDVVYVDSFEFVERGKATKYDLWQRYVDSFQRIPLYHWTELKPILATWDDHDYGTNDGDRTFISKDDSRLLFKAFFAGRDLPGVWESGPTGVSSRFEGFGQRFYLMDDRILRQPKKDKHPENFGHWGQAQHKWLLDSLKKDNRPAWVFNGNQMFNGKSLDFKEAFEQDHPEHFRRFIEDLKNVHAPVAFASGDIHFSEVMKIPKERLGYETYELTSSSMHSYTGDGWDNPARVPGAQTIEFNFMMVTSEAAPQSLRADVRAVGLAKEDLFKLDFKVQR